MNTQKYTNRRIPGLLLLAATAIAHADGIYRWTDSSGHVHFSDQAAAGSSPLAPQHTNTFTPVELNPRYYGSGSSEERFEYYYANPQTRQDFHNALFAATPIQINGRKFLGSTQWVVNWKYQTRMDGAMCKIWSANAIANITYIMPQLGNTSMLPKATVNAFNSYYARLLEHEEGHGESGRLAAKAMQAGLYNIPPAKSCSDIAAAANLFKSTVEQYNKRDKEYDASTGHGRTQGASIDDFL